jgi:prevent-host-death family protein
MRFATIKDAKAHLNELVDAAVRGEQVVLMRRSRHVAAIVALSPEELELPSRLTDGQAERLWRTLGEERASGKTVELASPAEAVAHLTRASRRRGAASKRSGKR